MEHDFVLRNGCRIITVLDGFKFKVAVLSKNKEELVLEIDTGDLDNVIFEKYNHGIINEEEMLENDPFPKSGTFELNNKGSYFREIKNE